MQCGSKNAQVPHMTLDMTCIDLSASDLLGCAFGLSKREVSVLLRLLASGNWVPVAALASRAGRDRSVVQRALASLASKGLVERDHRNRERGGYEYVYRARDKQMIKREILGKSRAFAAMVAAEVERW